MSNIPATKIAPEKKRERPSQAKSVLKDLSTELSTKQSGVNGTSRIVRDTASHKRVQLLRAEYWEKVKNLDFKDLVFLDEMGVLLGLMRTHARAAPGERAYDFKPFYRGSKVSVIGAITVSSTGQIDVWYLRLMNASILDRTLKAYRIGIHSNRYPIFDGTG
ncbi:MAG: hypothetical protein RLZZ499_2981, partial [Cyanobacteriota bacterium]